MNDIWAGLQSAVILIVTLDADLVDITLRSLQVSLSALVIASAIALPFGTWLEVLFQDADHWVKRKLSWYSPVTDRCMLVNNRGASCESITMNDLAKMMSAKKARTFKPQKQPLMDRALKGIFKKLKGITMISRD